MNMWSCLRLLKQHPKSQTSFSSWAIGHYCGTTPFPLPLLPPTTKGTAHFVSTWEVNHSRERTSSDEKTWDYDWDLDSSPLLITSYLWTPFSTYGLFPPPTPQACMDLSWPSQWQCAPRVPLLHGNFHGPGLPFSFHYGKANEFRVSNNRIETWWEAYVSMWLSRT
jgi:hypothetical protein